MRRVPTFLVVLSAFATGPAIAQDAAPGAAIEAAEPPSIRLDRVRLDVETAGTTGSWKTGTMCVSSDRFTWNRVSNRDVSQAFYESRFAEAMTGSGFTVIDPSRNMFAAEGPGAESDFLVGAIVLPRTVDVCSTQGGRFRGQVAADVEFQLFDNRTDEVVYSVTYRGQAEYPEFRESGNLGTLIAASFRDAAAQFAADPEVLARAGT